jgi:hypothetical protein
LDYSTKQYVDVVTQAAGVGTIRALRPAMSWGQDSATSTIQHTAFPSVVERRDGVLYMVVRRGTNHSATRDGGIWYSLSTDNGRSWGTPVQLFAASGGVEYRDPCVSLSVDGTKIYLTYFKGSAALGAAGCFFRTSTDGGLNWSAETRFDGSKGWAACSAPVVELSNGRLIAPFYGKDLIGDSNDSAYIATSINGGSSWSQSKIHNGVTAGRDYQEPWVSRKPGADNLFMTFRWGTNTSIATSTSTQTDGAGWSAASQDFVGTGRPSTVWLSTGEVFVIYRDTGNQLMYSRWHNGTAWSGGRLVRRAPSGGFWTYGQIIEISPGMGLCVLSEENSGLTPSKVFVTTIARGGGISPLGPIPSDALAVATNYDNLQYATTFQERVGTSPGPEWIGLNGALTITTDGYLSSASADNVPDRAYVDLNAADVILEADLYMTVQSGAAVLFRVVDANNFLMWTVETVGVNMRLYKVVAGVATQLTTSATSVIMGTWNIFTVEATGALIRGYINGAVVSGYTLTAGAEQSTFTTPGKHGISLNAQTGGVHYCRRFLATAL